MKDAAIIMLIAAVLVLALQLDQVKKNYAWDREQWAAERNELYDQLYPTGCCSPSDETHESCETPILGNDC